MRGVRFQHSASQAGRANRQEVTVTFRKNSIAGPVVNVSPNNAWRTTVANSNVGENAAGARVRISYAAATAFSSFKLTHWNATGGAQYHRVFLSDLSFSSTGC
jgi:hypothetical protein